MKHPVYALIVAACLSVGLAGTPSDVSAQILVPEPVAEALSIGFHPISRPAWDGFSPTPLRISDACRRWIRP